MVQGSADIENKEVCLFLSSSQLIKDTHSQLQAVRTTVQRPRCVPETYGGGDRTDPFSPLASIFLICPR